MCRRFVISVLRQVPDIQDMPLVPRNQRVRGLLSDQRKSAGNGLLGPGLQPVAPGVSGQDATARGHRDANAESLPVLVGIRHRHNQERGGDTPEIRHMAMLHDGRPEFCRCVHSNLREVGAGNDGAVSRFLVASDLQELSHKVLYLWMKGLHRGATPRFLRGADVPVQRVLAGVGDRA